MAVSFFSSLKQLKRDSKWSHNCGGQSCHFLQVWLQITALTVCSLNGYMSTLPQTVAFSRPETTWRQLCHHASVLSLRPCHTWYYTVCTCEMMLISCQKIPWSNFQEESSPALICLYSLLPKLVFFLKHFFFHVVSGFLRPLPFFLPFHLLFLYWVPCIVSFSYNGMLYHRFSSEGLY